MRAAIYARYSSDQQDERSIEDQLALCRDYAERNGWRIAAEFHDAGISGASELNRPEFLRLQQFARDGRCEIVLAEDLDRLTRNLADQARLFERLVFVGAQIFTVADGLISEMHIGLKGTMNALFLKNLALKVRRGQAGRARDGFAPGGLTYGYDAVPGQPGRRAINQDHAAIVRRIFAEYLAGETPRAIAAGLNRDCVPAPRGRAWNASTINGQGARGSGILNNALYAGRLVWNKTHYLKNPDTARRIARINPADARQITDVPELAIIDAATFEAAQSRRAERGKIDKAHARRPKRLLSGLLRCAACGAGMSSLGVDKTGRPRIRCTGAAERGDCPDPRTFYVDAIETAVLDALRGELRAPAVIAEYVKTYHAERARLAADAGQQRARIDRRLGEIERESRRVVTAIAKGTGDADLLLAATKELAAERAQLVSQLAGLPEVVNVVSLHPAVLARYEAQISALARSVAKGIDAGDGDALAVRELIESVTVKKAAPPLAVEIAISGRLGALLGDRSFPNGVRAVVGGDGCGGRI